MAGARASKQGPTIDPRNVGRGEEGFPYLDARFVWITSTGFASWRVRATLSVCVYLTRRNIFLFNFICYSNIALFDVKYSNVYIYIYTNNLQMNLMAYV